MNSSHRRPLVAYVLVSVAGAVVVAQGLAVGLGLPTLVPFLSLDPAQQQVADGRVLVEEPETSAAPDDAAAPTAPGDASFLDGIDVDDESLTLGSGTPATPAEPVAPDEAVSAAPKPGNGTGPVRSNLVGPSSSDGGDGPELGGPALDAPGAEAPAEEETAGEDPKPAPHAFSDTDPKAHPYGTAQPPRGQAKGHDTVKPTTSPEPEKQPKADKPETGTTGDTGKPVKGQQDTSSPGKSDKGDQGKSGTGKSDKGKGDKGKGGKGKSDKGGKGLAKGQGKVAPGSRGKKHG